MPIHESKNSMGTSVNFQFSPATAGFARSRKTMGCAEAYRGTSHKQPRRLVSLRLIDDNTFIEVFVDCPVEVCEQRDPKHAYRKAREGIIKEFTGISAPYEAPENPEIHLQTDKLSVEKCVRLIRDYLAEHEYIRE